MKAVILAGGVGTRLRPLTDKRPKPLIPVGGKMCIEYVIESLAKAKFRKIIITTGYMSDKLIQTIGDGARYDASVLYSFEEKPAGTAGAVKMVGDFLDSTFVVASGDVLADVDLKSLYDFHKEKGAMATIALTRVQDPTDFGVVDVDDEGRIKRFQEKPKGDEIFSDLVNAGIYILEPEVMEYIPNKKPFDFSKNVFPILLEKKLSLYGSIIPGLWRDIGRPSDLLMASMDVVNKRFPDGDAVGEPNDLKEKEIDIQGPVIFGKDVRLGVRTRIVGPAYIGNGVRIGRDSIIERCCIYDSVKIDREAIMKDSIVLEGCCVGWKNEIESSIIGYSCSLEDDVKLYKTILGDETVVNKHSVISEANISTSN